MGLTANASAGAGGTARVSKKKGKRTKLKGPVVQAVTIEYGGRDRIRPLSELDAGQKKDTLDRLDGKLRARLVCSEPWCDICHAEIVTERVPYRDDFYEQCQVLRKRCVYPPDGLLTKMVRCSTCPRWVPPNVVGSSGQCLDCYYCGLSIFREAMVPSSVGVFGGRLTRNAAMNAGLTVRGPRGTCAIKSGPDDVFIVWNDDVQDAGKDFVRQRRYLRGDGGRQAAMIVEELRGDDGFIKENLYELVTAEEAAARAAHAAVDSTGKET